MKLDPVRRYPGLAEGIGARGPTRNNCREFRRTSLDLVEPPSPSLLLPSGPMLVAWHTDHAVCNTRGDVNACHQEDQDDIELRKRIVLYVVALGLIQGRVNLVSASSARSIL